MNWIRVAPNTEKWCASADSVGAHPVTVSLITRRLFLSRARLIQSTPPCNVGVNTWGLKLRQKKIYYCGTADVTCNSLFIFQSTDRGVMKHQVAEGGGGKGSTGDGALGGLTASYLLPVTFSFRITAVFDSCFPSTAFDLTIDINLWQVDCKVVKSRNLATEPRNQIHCSLCNICAI
jgi:hypothetical protein